MEQPLLLANQPATMAIQLTEQQRALLYQLELLETSDQLETKKGDFIHSRIGINADSDEEKPIETMVGLLARDKQYWPIDERYVDIRTYSHAGGLYWYNNISHYDRLPCSLILASNSTIKEWKYILDKTTLKYIILSKLTSIENLKAQDYQVLIVTPSMYNTLINMYQKHTWKRIIISDPCNMSIPDMARCSAGFYWLITPTPDMLVSRKANNTNRLIKDIVGTDYSIINKYQDLILRSKKNI